jgi:hypothetical protein
MNTYKKTGEGVGSVKYKNRRALLPTGFFFWFRV